MCVGSLVSFRYIFGKDPVLSLDIGAIGRVLLHTAVLYLGPILQRILEAHEGVKHNKEYGVRMFLRACYAALVDPVVRPLLRPVHISERWMRLRDVVIAPVAEEVAFRACIASALATTGMSTVKISWVAPLFFGVAHLHHALLRIKQKQKISMVLLQSVFQFAYTTLFGSYATFAFLKTNDLVAVSLSHSFCNIMGLPDLAFVRSSSSVHKYRNVLWAAHVAGVGVFVYGLKSSLVFPLVAATTTSA